MLCHICLVKYQNHGQTCLVENTACIEHITHESHWICWTRRINYIRNHSGKSWSKSFCNYCTGSRPSENFNLTRGIHKNIIKLICSLLNNWYYLKSDATNSYLLQPNNLFLMVLTNTFVNIITRRSHLKSLPHQT